MCRQHELSELCRKSVRLSRPLLDGLEGAPRIRLSGIYRLQMREQLSALAAGDDRCRIVAGFCWGWSEPRRDGSLVTDVSDPKFGGWSAPWIEKGDRYAEPTQHRYFRWANDDTCFNQVGSIYSVQGFEFDYVGV